MGWLFVKRQINQDEEIPIHNGSIELNEGQSNLDKDIKESLLIDVFQHAMDAMIIYNKDGRIIEANTAFCSIMKEERVHILGKTLEEIQLQQILDEVNHIGTEKRHIVIRLKNGEEKHLEFSAKINSLAGYVITIFRDNSERYQMEKDLHVSEQKFRRIFEDSINCLALWNDQLRIVDINSTGEKMFGLSKEKLKGQLLFEVIGNQKENKSKILHHISQVLQFGNHTTTVSFETNTGEKRQFEFSSKREIVEGLNFTIIEDISEKIEMQEQLRKSDRLNVIGELAAGIAHEIRNPMTSLKGFIQLLENSIKAEHALYYQVITSELARIDSIINEFLILAKPQVIRFQEMDINQIMKETVDLLNAQAVLYNVQFKIHYDSSLPSIYCEPNQLKKVFINIIKNAIEVMPNGGNITITTKRMESNQVHISIQDEGEGISKDRVKKLGEPFYTTKERGTGLGLMVSYKIIEEHQGLIQIESELGKGSIFHIFLPLDLKQRMK